MSQANESKQQKALEDYRIATPCKADWTKMAGDERVRFCGSCEKYVYNVTGMSRAEAEDLVRGQGEVCMRLSRRADGTIITNDCPVGVQSKARKLKAVAIAGGTLIAASALLLRNRVFADEPAPRATAHVGDVKLGASCATKPASQPNAGGSFWESLAELVGKKPEPQVRMGEMEAIPPPEPPMMGRMVDPQSKNQPVPQPVNQPRR